MGFVTDVPDCAHCSISYGTVSTEATRGGTRDAVPPVSAETSVVIPCDREGVLVDLSSGCVQSNVGDAILNIHGERMDIGSNSDRARQQAKYILGKLCGVPPGVPPPIPWRVLGAETSTSASGEDVLPVISVGSITVSATESPSDVDNVRKS